MRPISTVWSHQGPWRTFMQALQVQCSLIYFKLAQVKIKATPGEFRHQHWGEEQWQLPLCRVTLSKSNNLLLSFHVFNVVSRSNVLMRCFPIFYNALSGRCPCLLSIRCSLSFSSSLAASGFSFWRRMEPSRFVKMFGNLKVYIFLLILRSSVSIG